MCPGCPPTAQSCTGYSAPHAFKPIAAESDQPFRSGAAQTLFLPIHADHTEGHDRCSAAHHIHADENVAEQVPKKPLAASEVCHNDERHHNYGHWQVRHRKGHQKVVWRLPKFLHHAHRNHHQRVSHHGHGRDHRQHDPDNNLLRAPEIQ